MALLTYCGGLPDVTKTGEYAVEAFPEYIVISSGLFAKKHKLSFDCITDVTIKTDEQISKDVTLTRLLLVGVLAFGAKKKTKTHTNYLVIDFVDAGISSSLILTGKEIPKFHAELMKARQKYYKRHPEKVPAAAAPASGLDPYAEIEKLHGLLEKGIITQEEFDAKKAQLLNL